MSGPDRPSKSGKIVRNEDAPTTPSRERVRPPEDELPTEPRAPIKPSEQETVIGTSPLRDDPPASAETAIGPPPFVEEERPSARMRRNAAAAVPDDERPSARMRRNPPAPAPAPVRPLPLRALGLALAASAVVVLGVIALGNRGPEARTRPIPTDPPDLVPLALEERKLGEGEEKDGRFANARAHYVRAYEADKRCFSCYYRMRHLEKQMFSDAKIALSAGAKELDAGNWDAAIRQFESVKNLAVDPQTMLYQSADSGIARAREGKAKAGR